MSLTLELLRMETQQHGGNNDSNSNSNSNNHSDLFWAQHRLHQQFLVLGNDGEKAANANEESNATTTTAKSVNCAKVIAEAPHSYYDCCINVHVSSLLEHWLDWDRPSRRSSSSGLASPPHLHYSNNTAKSLMSDATSSPPPSPSSTGCDCPRRCPHNHHHHHPWSAPSSSPSSASSSSDSDSESDCIGSSEEQAEWIRQICAKGCDDINRTDADGKTILHYLLEGNDVKIYGNSLVDCARLLLETGSDPNARDARGGNTALLHVQHLLCRGLFAEAVTIAQMMLEKSNGDDDIINQVNASNRTLLSCSVTYGDKAADLTRLLLNYGAKVWPSSEVIPAVPAAATAATPSTKEDDEKIVFELTKERDQSAFTWFLRSIMRRQTLDESEETLELLCHAMGEHPARMRQHVPRTMLELGKGAGVIGPLFLRLKERMAPYWSRPQPLKYQCLKRIRRSMGPKRLNNRGCVARLKLPPKLQKAVLLEEVASSR